jgi:hypothetical protein
MEEFGTPVAHLHNVVSYLNMRGVTTLLVNEVEYITGDLRATELGVSHLADNILLMRHAEHWWSVSRAKARSSGLSPPGRDATFSVSLPVRILTRELNGEERRHPAAESGQPLECPPELPCGGGGERRGSG